MTIIFFIGRASPFEKLTFEIITLCEFEQPEGIQLSDQYLITHRCDRC